MLIKTILNKTHRLTHFVYAKVSLTNSSSEDNAEDEEFVARAVAEMDNLIKQKAKDNL